MNIETAPRLPFIIAEAAQGYEGNEKVVDLLIKATASAGADAVKFQIMVADDSALPDYQHYESYKKLELPWEVWENAIQEAHRRNIMFYMEALGTTAIEKLSSKGIDGYKIHATNIKNEKILKLVAATKKAVLLSTGGCEKEEIDRALAILEGCEVTIMHGFQAVPTGLPDNHIRRIVTLREIYGLPIGFQGHTDGDSEFAPLVPLLALGAGAILVEQHITLSRKAKMRDHISALNTEEFARWVTMIRQISSALGNKEWVLTEKEREYRKEMRRAVCSLVDIAKGETVKEDHIAFKRTARADVIYDLREVIGKMATRVIARNSPLKKEDFM